MKLILAAFALAIATPAFGQTPEPPVGHSRHGQPGHSQHGQPGHGQHGQSGHGQHGDREGQRHDCPCCRPAADGQRPACCERMHQQSGERTQGHGSH